VFWTIAATVVFFAAIITFFPALRGRKSLWQPLALALTFLLPVAALWIYNEVGTPDAIDMKPITHPAAGPSQGQGQAADMETMIDGLRDRLVADPNDLDGWMLLARSLKITQRYAEARDALENAHGLAPDDPFVMVELAEAYIFVSQDGRIGEEIIALLQRALDIDPTQQKALWLLGIAASQSGDDEAAIAHWESLLGLVEPGSTVEGAVQAQINEAKARLGQEVVVQAPVAAGGSEVQSPGSIENQSDGQNVVQSEGQSDGQSVDQSEGGAWQGIDLTVSVNESDRSAIPTGGVLYVMIRTPGPAMGPPLGVHRVIDPILPLRLKIDDRDSMIKERQISSETELQIQARISQTGSPAASPGDWQSVTRTVSVDSGEAVELVLDQKVE